MLRSLIRIKMVPKGGLEPPWVAPHAPQTCVSTSSTTSALVETFYHRVCNEHREIRNQHFMLPLRLLCSVADLLFFHRRLLRRDGGDPACMPAVTAVDDIEERGLQR